MIILIVKTRKGHFRKIALRGISTSPSLSINSGNGRDLDRTSDIADALHGDRAAIANYFSDKENSIRQDYRIDSNSGAVAGVSAHELHS
jgi:hypothetical protein